MPTGENATYKAVLRRFENTTSAVKWYLEDLPSLLKGYRLEVSLAWVYLRIEQTHHRALYCGVIRLHRADRELAEKTINAHHMTRDGFTNLFRNIYGAELTKATRGKIEKADKIRDNVIHGKEVSNAEMRSALVDLIEYAELLNAEVKHHIGLEPCGSLIGFKGRAKSLDKNTTRWLLKGLGFFAS